MHMSLTVPRCRVRVKGARNRSGLYGVAFSQLIPRGRTMETYDSRRSTTEVRQGSPRMMNFRVLILSLVGVLAVFGIIFAISTAIQPGGEGSVTQPGVQPTPSDVPADDIITAPIPTT